MPRAHLNVEPESSLVSSGCFMLDLVLGGGWGRGRIVNLVGDKSSGKTLLAVEACANYAQVSSPGHIRYLEAESAFDDDYARLLGMPDGMKITSGIDTVEEFYEDLKAFLKERSGEPSLYVVDSLDALSDATELDTGFDKGSFGTSKARQLSKLFRQLVGDIARANCTLMIVSQIRDKIGVMFGERHTRSGGRALDFYSSQILWLSEIAKIKRTVMKAERVVGIKTLARMKKNKIGNPFRQAELTLLFRYGIDDEETMLSWLESNKALDRLPDGMDAKDIRKRVDAARQAQDKSAMFAVQATLRKACRVHWEAIENALAPTMRKYS